VQRVSLVIAVLIGAAALASVALAERPATTAEANAIKPLAMKACGYPKEHCVWRSAEISTINSRYGFGEAVGEGFYGVMVVRASVNPLRYRVIHSIGGGIGPCSVSFPASLRAIALDLHLCLKG
jgi:hypothetical protein